MRKRSKYVITVSRTQIKFKRKFLEENNLQNKKYIRYHFDMETKLLFIDFLSNKGEDPNVWKLCYQRNGDFVGSFRKIYTALQIISDFSRRSNHTRGFEKPIRVTPLRYCIDFSIMFSTYNKEKINNVDK